MNILKFALLALCTLFASVSPSSAATEWIMATGVPDSSYLTKNIRMFIDEIEQGSNGQLKITLHSNSTLIKRAAIKRAVQSGQVHLGELDFAAYGNEDPMYVLDATPGLVPTVEASKRLWELQLPYLNKLFATNGMRILYTGLWPGQGFYTKVPVKTVADFKGKKLRVYSTATQKMGELLGFSPTILPFAEVPQAFATGLIDAMYTSAQTGVDTQAWDFTKYFYLAGAGVKAPVVVNEQAFQSLSADLQKLILAAAGRAYARNFPLLSEAAKASSDELVKHGMIVGDLPPEVAKEFLRIGVIMLEDWRKAASPEANAVLDTYLKELPK